MSSQKLLRIAFVQAVLAMIWSLYFSNFGDPLTGLFSGSWFEPCHLCWWTRILMYPLVWILGYAMIRREYAIAYLTVFISGVGILLSWYHYTIQHINSLNVFTCNPWNPCTLIDWKMFGYITIPALACTAFIVIFVSSILIIRNIRHNKSLMK